MKSRGTVKTSLNKSIKTKKHKIHICSMSVTSYQLPGSKSDAAQENIYIFRIPMGTKQLSYRKDDRAMRPIYGCPENFESPDYPTTTFPELCNGRLFRSILRTCVQNWKFVALLVPEIIGCTQKISAVPGYAHAPFSPKFLAGFCSRGYSKYTCQI